MSVDIHECPKNDLLHPLGTNCTLLAQIAPILAQIAPSWCKLRQFRNQGVRNAKKHPQTVQLFVVVCNAKKIN